MAARQQEPEPEGAVNGRPNHDHGRGQVGGTAVQGQDEVGAVIGVTGPVRPHEYRHAGYIIGQDGK